MGNNTRESHTTSSHSVLMWITQYRFLIIECNLISRLSGNAHITYYGNAEAVESAREYYQELLEIREKELHDIQECIKELDDLERDILTRFIYKGQELRMIARDLYLSESFMSNLFVRSLKKIQTMKKAQEYIKHF